MGQISLQGADKVRFLETLVVADEAGLAAGTGTLSVFNTSTGGIIDENIITTSATRSRAS
jgi:glycine cleavage system aminomethyltransferase T